MSGLKSDVYNTTGSLEVALLSHALSMNAYCCVLWWMNIEERLGVGVVFCIGPHAAAVFTQILSEAVDRLDGRG